MQNARGGQYTLTCLETLFRFSPKRDGLQGSPPPPPSGHPQLSGTVSLAGQPEVFAAMQSGEPGHPPPLPPGGPPPNIPTVLTVLPNATVEDVQKYRHLIMAVRLFP